MSDMDHHNIRRHMDLSLRQKYTPQDKWLFIEREIYEFLYLLMVGEGYLTDLLETLRFHPKTKLICVRVISLRVVHSLLIKQYWLWSWCCGFCEMVWWWLEVVPLSTFRLTNTGMLHLWFRQNSSAVTTLSWLLRACFFIIMAVQQVARYAFTQLLLPTHALQQDVIGYHQKILFQMIFFLKRLTDWNLYFNQIFVELPSLGQFYPSKNELSV